LKVLGIVGWSGSGKTTLLTALIPCFRARGFSVSTIKHAHHALALDTPGKDSHRHREAGAAEVILASAARFALFSEHGQMPEPGLDALLARLAPVDLVLVEGFRSYDFPKIEVYRPALGKKPLWPDMAVLAVATDAALPACPVPVLDMSAPEAVTDFALAALGLNTPGRDRE
jgi:molybdopterin-guanine dinucleotide biosynthesis protein B